MYGLAGDPWQLAGASHSNARGQDKPNDGSKALNTSGSIECPNVTKKHSFVDG
jgi:hypothetical protein